MIEQILRLQRKLCAQRHSHRMHRRGHVRTVRTTWPDQSWFTSPEQTGRFYRMCKSGKLVFILSQSYRACACQDGAQGHGEVPHLLTLSVSGPLLRYVLPIYITRSMVVLLLPLGSLLSWCTCRLQSRYLPMVPILPTSVSAQFHEDLHMVQVGGEHSHVTLLA